MYIMYRDSLREHFFRIKGKTKGVSAAKILHIYREICSFYAFRKKEAAILTAIRQGRGPRIKTKKGLPPKTDPED